MKLTRKERTLVSFLVRAVVDENGEVDTQKVKEAYKILQKSEMSSRNKVINAWFGKVKTKIDSQTLFIDSAVELSGREIESIKKIFERKLDRKIVAVARVTDSILGGLRVRFGDEVWDDSLDSRLRQIGQVIEQSEF